MGAKIEKAGDIDEATVNILNAFLQGSWIKFRGKGADTHIVASLQNSPEIQLLPGDIVYYVRELLKAIDEVGAPEKPETISPENSERLFNLFEIFYGLAQPNEHLGPFRVTAEYDHIVHRFFDGERNDYAQKYQIQRKIEDVGEFIITLSKSTTSHKNPRHNSRSHQGSAKFLPSSSGEAQPIYMNDDRIKACLKEIQDMVALVQQHKDALKARIELDKFIGELIDQCRIDASYIIKA